MACQSCLDQTTLSLRPGPAVSTPGGAAMGGRPWLTRVPRPAQAPVEGSLWSKTCPALAFSTHHWHPWPFPSLFFIVGPTALSVPICTLYLRFAICSAQNVRPHTHTHTHTHITAFLDSLSSFSGPHCLFHVSGQSDTVRVCHLLG